MTAPISAEVERDLVERWQAGDRAAGAALLAANEALLWKMVGSRAHSSRREDAMQTARLGLLRGARKFDARSTNRLVGYASKWARGEALKAADEDATVTVTRYAIDEVRKAERAGREAPERFALAAKYRRAESMDAPQRIVVGGHEFMVPSLATSIPSADPTPEDLLDAPLAERRRCLLVGQALATLTQREQEVIRRSELADEPETFADIARSIGVSRERVRQVHDEAMGKLERALRRLMTAADAVLWGERRKQRDGIATGRRVRRDTRAIRAELLRTLADVGELHGWGLGDRLHAIAGRRAVYAQLQALVEQGLVAVRADPSHAQVKRYSLTDAGRDAALSNNNEVP